MIMGVDALRFDEDKLRTAPVFRTRFDGCMTVYCTEAFKLAIQTNGFEVLLFRQNLTAQM